MSAPGRPHPEAASTPGPGAVVRATGRTTNRRASAREPGLAVQPVPPAVVRGHLHARRGGRPRGAHDAPGPSAVGRLLTDHQPDGALEVVVGEVADQVVTPLCQGRVEIPDVGVVQLSQHIDEVVRQRYRHLLDGGPGPVSAHVPLSHPFKAQLTTPTRLRPGAVGGGRTSQQALSDGSSIDRRTRRGGAPPQGAPAALPLHAGHMRATRLSEGRRCESDAPDTWTEPRQTPVLRSMKQVTDVRAFLSDHLRLY
jgi:hypothetical protein